MIGAAALMAQRICHVQTIRLHCARTKTLVLTYDDGPGVHLTSALLDLLDSFAAKATWFALGCRAESAPDVMDQLVSRGHEVGCHTYQHLHGWRERTGRVVEDVERGFDVLLPWLRSRPLFRPPHGKLSLPMWRAASARGARLGWWTHAVNDTDATVQSPDVAVERIVHAGGAVALMHDFDRGVERAEHVLQVTERLLVHAANHAWRVCALSDLLDELQPRSLDRLTEPVDLTRRIETSTIRTTRRIRATDAR